MSYRVLPLTYRRTRSSHRDRKGSFTTRPTGNVDGFKNVIKRAYCLQQPACWHNTSKAVVACLGGGENLRAPEKNHCKLVRYRQNRVDITKHKCRDIGLHRRQCVVLDGSPKQTSRPRMGPPPPPPPLFQKGQECIPAPLFRSARNTSQPRLYHK